MNAPCQKQSRPLLAPISEQLIQPTGSSHPAITEKEYSVLKCELGYWRMMHSKALLREEAFQKTIKRQEGQIRDLKNRLFGKKSEKNQIAKEEGSVRPTDSKRSRGQQPGSKGHGRTVRPHLPEVDEPICLPDIPKCSKCGIDYALDESKESEIIEVEVKAYKRKIIRSCFRKGCSCSGVPSTVIAPMPYKLIARSPYGISIWEAVLLNKFHYSQPTNRLLNQYTELGLPISAGSITGGLKILKNLFQPVYDAFYSQQMTEERFHNDESGWKVFESIDDKIGNKWWLWVCRSPSVVFFQIAPGRGADVPVEHFQNTEKQKIIIICDRYSAYKSLARQMSFIILAFCWAHVRRDFLDAAKKYPELEEWALYWVEKIGELYHINKQRCKEFNQEFPAQRQSALFKKQHETIIEKMGIMTKERDAFMNSYQSEAKFNLLADVKCKILTSLKNHWQGLSVFVEHPEVPMDNNNGERSIRNPITGRKNFYGSGSLWSSQLAAMMFSIFQTLALGGLNLNHWLRLYLTSCAENHGNAPKDLAPFLPWEMASDRKRQLAKPFGIP